MRFYAEGPSIPNELLDARDRGEVVFFCGAGVSIPAGLPNFVGLAERVMKELGTGPHEKSRALLERFRREAEDGQGGSQLDRVFNLLQEDYQPDEIDEVVSRVLKTPRRPNITPHATVLRLSRGADGVPRVVTTNFDQLFERASPSLAVHIAPALPDIESVGSFEGLVYLHGRRSDPGPYAGRRQNRLVLSSSDLGRAYLAEGWATRFVRELLQNYYIVLLGYQASDPPIEYLLEGLQSRRGNKPSTIYAFDAGGADLDRWRGRGVHAIPYPQDPSHTVLWDTLSAWATRADDPDAWRRSVVSLAQRRPRELEPFQRGQVAALLQATEGGAAFATATPPPSAEWVCVLDARVRCARVRRPSEDRPDPASLYGLDDDPPPPDREADTPNQDAAAGVDLVSTIPGDERTDRNKRLAGLSGRYSDTLPARLRHIAIWFGRVADQPTALWWAAGYTSLHPQLVQVAEWRLQTGGGSAEPWRRWWALLLERFRHSPEDPRRDPWHPFMQRLRDEGWTTAALRDFERAAMPYLVASRLSVLTPPPEDEGPQSLRPCVHFEVVFPSHDTVPPVPGEHLPRVFEIVRRGLDRGAGLLSDIGRDYWHTASFEPPDGPGVTYLDEASSYLHWARQLFDRLARERPEVALDELRRWPLDDPYFFAKLAIYAWGFWGLGSGEEAAKALLTMPDQQFWDPYHRRELLHTLRARWQAFDSESRKSFESRILAGAQQSTNEADEDYRTRSARTAAEMLGWLELVGCELTDQGRQDLHRLKESIPGWQDSWANLADYSLDSRAGSVALQSEPGALIELPLSELPQAAEQGATEDWAGFVRREPFQGLVQQRPRRALLALTLGLRRHQHHHVGLWRVLLSYWPDDANDRVLCLCGGRLAELPDALLANLEYQAYWWFCNHVQRLARLSPGLAYRLFDRLLHVVSSRRGDGAGSPAESAAILTEVSGRRSRSAFLETFNSPIGLLTRGLLSVLGGLSLGEHSGLPAAISSRLERLVGAPGEGASHAVCLMANRLHWLHWLDPAWTRRRLIPLFKAGSDSAEPSWSGLLQANQMPERGLFARLKGHLLEVFESGVARTFDEDTQKQVVGLLVTACSLRYVSFADVRTALRTVDDAARAHALWLVAHHIQVPGQWAAFGRGFLRRAWPRERRYQTAAVARALMFLAERSGEDFPDAVRTALPFIVPTERLDMELYRVTKEDGEKPLARRFPDATLELLNRLVPDDPHPVPNDLGPALTLIVEGKPSLRADARWRRLRRIAESG